MRVTGWPRPTAAGIAVGATTVALVVLGWSLGYIVLTVAAAATAAAIAAAWLAALSVPRIEVSRVLEPVRVERGQPALGLVSVRNMGRRRSRSLTALETVSDAEIDVAIPSLAAGRSTSVTYRLPTRRRGSFVVGPLSITRRDPFGLWEARRRVGDELALLVLPRVHPLDPRPSGRARHMEGPVSDTAPRGTLTFHTLREYVPGDDVRRVHWRSTARTGTLMVREHVDTSLPSTVVVLDTRRDRFEGDSFEDAVDVVASVAAASQDRGFPVRLVTTDGTVQIVRSGQRGESLRTFLASVQPVTGGGDLNRAAVEVLRGRDHDAIIVVSGDVDHGDIAAVTTMTRRFARSALVTVRPGREGDVVRWAGGMHLDGTTAADALARWQASSTPTARVGAVQ